MNILSSPPGSTRTIMKINQANPNLLASRTHSSSINFEGNPNILSSWKHSEMEIITQNGPVDMRYTERGGLGGGAWKFGTASFNTDIPYFQGHENKAVRNMK
jgi:hypothetical protein